MSSEVYTVNLASRGIQVSDFDYSRIEDVIADIGPQLLKPHRHEFYLILMFTHGRGKHYLDFASYPIDPPIIFFVARNQIHHFGALGHLKGHMLRFTENYIWRYPAKSDATSQGSLFRVGRQPLRIREAKDASNLVDLLEQISGEKKRTADKLQNDLLYHLINAFLIQAKRLDMDSIADINFNTRKDIALYYKFFTLMEQHYLNHYTVSQYADQIGVCTKHLTEVCKAVTGKPAKQIIKERLLLEAKRCLRFSELTIKEISDMLNFNDYSYFSRFFFQAEQVSPSDYRNLKSEIFH